MGKIRMSLQDALKLVTKEQFEEVFHTTLSYNEMADILNISPCQVINLKKYWNLNWSKEEITERKRANANKVDKELVVKKRLATNEKLYGTKNPRVTLHPETYIYTKEQHDRWLDKYEKTSLERYGVTHYSMTEEFKSEMPKTFKNTMLERYGVSNCMAIKEVKDKVFSYSGYDYKNLHFDSSWELAFYIYCEDNNIHIIREPYIINYWYNNTKYSYYPDFLVDGKLIEIKGDVYVNEDHTEFTNSQVDKGKLEAKFKCMIENADEVLYYNDIKQYLNYITKTYGSTYLKQFKVDSE